MLQGDNEIQGVAQVQAQRAGNPWAVQAGGTRNTVVAMGKTEQKHHPGNRNLDSELACALPHAAGCLWAKPLSLTEAWFHLKDGNSDRTNINIAAPWGPSAPRQARGLARAHTPLRLIRSRNTQATGHPAVQTGKLRLRQVAERCRRCQGDQLQ